MHHALGILSDYSSAIYGYLKKYNDAALHFRTGIPDYSEQDVGYVKHSHGNILSTEMFKKKYQAICMS